MERRSVGGWDVRSCTCGACAPSGHGTRVQAASRQRRVTSSKEDYTKSLGWDVRSCTCGGCAPCGHGTRVQAASRQRRVTSSKEDYKKKASSAHTLGSFMSVHQRYSWNLDASSHRMETADRCVNRPEPIEIVHLYPLHIPSLAKITKCQCVHSCTHLVNYSGRT